MAPSPCSLCPHMFFHSPGILSNLTAHLLSSTAKASGQETQEAQALSVGTGEFLGEEHSGLQCRAGEPVEPNACTLQANPAQRLSN